MDLEILKEDIKNSEPLDIYHKYLLTNQVWYFKEHLKKENPIEHLEKFKFFLSKNLDLHVNNITIVGSAKTGYSFAPNKNFKSFDENSDFDLVLVSREYFNFFWDAFYELKGEAHIYSYNYLTSCIFRKFISFKNLELNHRYEKFEKWLKQVDSLKKKIQTVYDISPEINFRIYESWQYVQNYHLRGIRVLKNNLTEDDG